jgi:hypothetical protein
METPSESIKFFGADTHEWIGVVLSDEAQRAQIEGTGGWGVRYKVAIMGHHPTDQTQVKDEDIQYANVVFGVTDGDGGANMQTSSAIRQGTVVRGKFLDGSARQMPEITGVYGKTSGTRFGKGRFDAKDGFGGNLKPGNLLGRDTTNETSSPPCVPRALPGAGDKTKKRETPKDALEAAGVDTTDNKAKVEDSKTPENNGLTAEEQAEILKEQQTGTVKTDEQLQAEEGGPSNTVPTEEVETREQRNAREEAEERAEAQALLDSGEFLF